jgi:hypothetical protein
LQTLFQTEPVDGLTDPDAIPAPPEEAVTQPGELWLLGEHRLLCGDSAKAEDVDRLLGGAKVHLVNTDPPYNVRVEPRSNNAIAAGLSSFPGSTHHQQLDRAAAGLVRQHRPRARTGPVFLPLGRIRQLRQLPAGLEGRGAVLRAGGDLGQGAPGADPQGLHGQPRVVLLRLARGRRHRFFGPNNATDVWSVKKVNPQSMVHLTQKPVELAARAMQYSSRPGECVLDLFGGSGSTLIAAEQTGRRAFPMELDAPYCDVIRSRWEQFTGKKAECRRAA